MFINNIKIMDMKKNDIIIKIRAKFITEILIIDIDLISFYLNLKVKKD